MNKKEREEQEEQRSVHLELRAWRRKVTEALRRSSPTELFNMWSAINNVKRGKLRKSYWYTKEVEQVVQKLLDIVGTAARRAKNVGV